MTSIFVETPLLYPIFLAACLVFRLLPYFDVAESLRGWQQVFTETAANEKAALWVT